MENGMPVDSVALSIQDTDLFSAVLSIPSVEKDFSITYKSYDLDDGEEQILPNVNRFTTRGPVQVDSYKLTPSNRSGEYQLQLQLANVGTEASVYDLKARVEALESCIIMSNSTFSADVINAGDAKTADGIIPFSTSDCSDVKVFPVQVNIYENDILYWVDTLEINLEDLLGMEDALDNKASLSLNIYPNPFQSNTHIYIDLDTQQRIILKVLNQSGSTIKIIANEFRAKGKHEFILHGSDLPAGVYYVQTIVGNITQIRKMIKLE
jgi:hypothetical protein